MIIRTTFNQIATAAGVHDRKIKDTFEYAISIIMNYSMNYTSGLFAINGG